MSDGKNSFEKTELYTNNVELTSQFRFCGNPFRIDTYRGCDFGCKYCFANNRTGSNFEGKINYQVGDINSIKKWFKRINEQNTKNINIELMQNKVPLHLGGMSDPFQSREWKHGITKEFLKLSVKYNYPVVISTKAAYLPEEYFDILNTEIHTFQISLINYDNELISKLETNTPTPKERISFIKELKRRGFWVSVRIQPLVDLEQADKIINECYGSIDYCTVEHLKLPKMNDNVWSDIVDKLSVEYKTKFRASKNKPEFELNSMTKLNNVKYLKEKYPKLKIGCGDNDLHHYSDSLNCCGVDTMPKAFNNWLKYNSMYIKMTGDKTQWYPKTNCSSCLNSVSRKNGFAFNNYVDEYHIKMFGDDSQQSLF